MTGRLDIYPGAGIGPIRHGMRPVEVLAVFPEPHVYEEWMGGNLNDALLFHGLRIHFDRCDACAPLPEATVNWVVIQHRDDAYLFDKPTNEWTRDDVLRELKVRGFDAELLATGDVEVLQQIFLSFDDHQRLSCVEI